MFDFIFYICVLCIVVPGLLYVINECKNKGSYGIFLFIAIFVVISILLYYGIDKLLNIDDLTNHQCDCKYC